MAETEPRALGRFRLVEPIATGTTATVWRAHDPKRRQDVVLKRFHPHVVADEQGRKRIAAEAAIAGRLRHPNIVSPIERLSGGGELALVFPHVAGGTLAARLAEGGRVAAPEAADITADIADALAAAHAKGVVHRDVKPGNVLLGDDGRARLLDFGISRSVAEASAVDNALTGAGMVVGTLPYMAPEQLAGRPATAAADVYALGAVLYEMLAGRRPYNASTPLALAEAQQTPPARIADAPSSLTELCLAALSSDPAQRPSAAAVAAAAREWDSAPIAPDAPTVAVAAAAPTTTSAGTGGRGRALAAVLVPAMGVLVVALVAMAALGGGATDPLTTAPPASNPVEEAAATAVPVPAEPAAQPAAQPAGRDAQPNDGRSGGGGNGDRGGGGTNDDGDKADKGGKADKPDKPEKPDKPDEDKGDKGEKGGKGKGRGK